jgi:hypothetical protein
MRCDFVARTTAGAVDFNQVASESDIYNLEVSCVDAPTLVVANWQSLLEVTA